LSVYQIVIVFNSLLCYLFHSFINNRLFLLLFLCCTGAHHSFLLVFCSDFVPEVAPFFRYWTYTYTVTLKSGFRVTQSHRNRHGSIPHLWLPINVI